MSLQGLSPVIALARNAVEWIPLDVRDVPPFAGRASASEHRAGVRFGSELVTIGALLAHVWRSGVPVVHFGTLPRGSGELRSFVGFADERPVVVLCSRRRASPWLAYHLAHALGHLMLGHVGAAGPPLADAGFDLGDEDQEEIDADAFARQLLLGDTSSLAPAGRRDAAAMLETIRSHAHARRVDPAIYALYVGLDTGEWAVVDEIVRALGEAENGHLSVAGSVAPHLPTICDDVHDTSMRFIDLAYEA